MGVLFFLMLKLINKVMGLLDQANNNKIISKIDEVKVDLSKEELEILLGTLKNSHFKGEIVETIYNLVWKLQNSYLSFPTTKPQNNK